VARPFRRRVWTLALLARRLLTRLVRGGADRGPPRTGRVVLEPFALEAREAATEALESVLGPALLAGLIRALPGPDAAAAAPAWALDFGAEPAFGPAGAAVAAAPEAPPSYTSLAPPADAPPPLVDLSDLDAPLPAAPAWWAGGVDVTGPAAGGAGSGSGGGSGSAGTGPSAGGTGAPAGADGALIGTGPALASAPAARLASPPPPAAVGPAAAGSAAAGPAAPGPAPVPVAPRAQDLGALPLRFEAAAGPDAAAAPFVARGSGYNLFVAPTGLTLVLAPPNSGDAADPRAAAAAADAAGAAGALPVHRLALVGSDPAAVVEGYAPLATATNYFLGDDPAAWRTGVPTYAGVAVRGVYPGIDLLVHGSAAGRLEYDFVVAPGADPAVIRYALPGADAVAVDGAGRLAASVGGGTVVHEAPVLYQARADGTREPVAGRYAVGPDGAVGFAPGAYDASRPLVVDPVLNFSGFLGGSGTDNGYGVAVGRDGSTYVTGSTLLAGFPVTGSAGATGGTDAFVARVAPDGSGLVYSTVLGGAGVDAGYGVAVDAAGFAYAAGSTAGGFPTAAPFQGGYGGGASDGFVASLTPAGGLRYSSYVGGAGADAANGVAVDAAGYAFAAGSTAGAGFPLTSPAQSTYGGGATDAFLVGVTPGGGSRTFATYLGGAGADAAYGVAVLGTGSGATVAVAGAAGTGFPTTAGAYDTTFGGGTSDAFLGWYTGAGAKTYATYLGGAGTDAARAVAVRDDGATAVAGSAGAGFPVTAGAAQAGYGGGATDAFLATFALLGAGGLTYSTYLGGTGADVGYGAPWDSAGGVYLAGSTAGGLATTAGAAQGTYGGGATDAFVARLDPGLPTTFGYLTYLGGTGADAASGAAANRFQPGLVSVAGTTASAGFPALYPVGSYGGGSDAFVARFGPGVPAPRVTAVTTDTGASAADRLTSDTSLTVSGVAPPGATVTLYRNGAAVGATTAAGGTWSVVDPAALGDGAVAYTATAALGGALSVPSAALVAVVDAAAPTVGVAAPTLTYDTTPLVRVTAGDLNGAGATFALDADLNNDGDFLDAGEPNYATGTLAYGTAEVELPALALGTYAVRARALDLAGNTGTSPAVTVRVAAAAPGVLAPFAGTTSAAASADPLVAGNVREALGLPWAGLVPDRGLRAPALVYNSESVDARPVVAVDVQTDNTTALPPSVVAALTWDGVVVATTTYATTGRAPGDLLSVALQPPTGVTGVGRHLWSVTVTLDYTAAPDVVLTTSGQTFVAAQDDSPYGAGWTFSNVDRLYPVAAAGGFPAGVLRTFGAGGWAFYAAAGGGAYASPPGDAGALAAAGGGWVYTEPNGNSRTFDAAGLQTAWTGVREAETFTYAYTDGDGDGQADDVRTVTGPDGVVGTFTYAANKLQSVASGPLVTTLAHAGANLSTATDPAGGVHTFTYAGAKLTGSQLGPVSRAWAYANGLAASAQAGTSPAAQLAPAAARGLGALAAGPRRAAYTAPSGRASLAEYDAFGNVAAAVAADGGTTRYARDPATGWATGVTDPLGRHTTFVLDAKGSVTRTEYPDGSVATATYAGTFQSRLTAVDGLGRTTSYAYDGSGRVTARTDPAGGVTSYTYSSGLVQTATDPLGRTTTYLYDAKRRLEAEVDPLGKRTTYAYDPAGRLRAVADPLNRTTSYAYDGVGRLLARTDPLGRTTSYAYDAAGDLLAVTDPLGRASSYAYDARGLPVASTDPLGRVTTTAYDADGRAAAVTDPLGLTTSYAYDGPGRAVGVVDPTGGASATAYDLAGQPLAARDPAGVLARTGYDALGRPVTATDATGAVTTTVYDAAGQVAAVVDPLNRRTSYAYDAAGRVLAVTDPTGAVASTVYDAAGRVTATVDPLNRRTSYAYDLVGRVLAVTDPTGAVASTVYDAAGQVTAVVDPLNRRTSYTYDAAGRPETVTDPTGAVASTVYDAIGQVTATVDPLGRRTSYAYDALGRAVAVTDPTGAVSTTAYDAAGRVAATTDPLGRVTEAAYDAAGRVTAVADPSGGVTQTAYDAAGRVRYAADPLGRVTAYDYDPAGRPVVVTDARAGVATTVYDAAGQVAATIDPLNRRTSYTYDVAGRVTEVRDGVGHRGTTAYDAAGQVAATIDPLNRRTSFTYDAAGRVLTVKDPTGAVASTVYDAAGQVAAAVDPLNRRTSYAYDAAGRVLAVTDPTGAVASTVYDAAGQVTAAVDPRGNRTSYTYDAAGRVLTVTDALGGVATAVYDAAGNAVAAVNPRGFRTTVAYDVLNRPVATTDALGGVATTVYDAAGQVTATVDPLGRRTSYAYDALGRVVATTNALGGVATTAYDAAGQVATATDVLGRVTSFAYDARGRTTRVTDPLGGAATTVYDAADQVTARIDPLGRATSYAYDAAGRATGVQDPLGKWTTTTYDAAGQVTAVEDPLNRRTSYTYDAAGRVLTLKDPTGAVASTVYDATGNATVRVDPRGHRTTLAYDALNRVATATDALGGVTTTAYDANGNATVRTDPLGFATTAVYDALDRRVAAVSPLGTRTTMAYDAAGQVTATIDGLGKATTTAYDALGRAVTTTDPRGGVTTSVYDAAGNRTALVDPSGNRTTWAYDALDRSVSETNPLGAAATTAYDAVGRVLSATDRLGRRVDHAYDAAGRHTTEKWYAAGGALAQTQTFTYDAAGQMLTAVDPDGAYTLTYDGAGRVATVKEPFGLALTFAYDGAGNRTGVQDSKGGVTTVTFDARNRQTSESVAGTGVTAVRVDHAYTARGQVAAVTRYTDLAGTSVATTLAYSYDADGRATNVRTTRATGAAVANYTYSYDAADRVTAKVENGTATIYAYDAADQLTADGAATFGYDATGNRTNPGYATGAGNRMTTDGVWTYTYDAAGSVIKKSKGTSAETWVYAYDHDGQLVTAAKSATDGGAATARVTYSYDALGHRVGRVAWDGATTTTERYGIDAWDPAKPAAVGTEDADAWVDLDGTNALVSRRVWGPEVNEAVARQVAGGAVTGYAVDHQGSVRGATDATGVLSGATTFAAFGGLTAGTLSDRFGFQGMAYDAATGLYLPAFGRPYDPAAGRFYGPDPLGFEAGDPNLARFIGNNPLNATDPSGMWLVVPKSELDVWQDIAHAAKVKLQIKEWGSAVKWSGKSDLGAAYGILAPRATADKDHDRIVNVLRNDYIAKFSEDDIAKIMQALYNGDANPRKDPPGSHMSGTYQMIQSVPNAAVPAEFKWLGPNDISAAGVPISELQPEDLPGPDVTNWFAADLSNLLLYRRRTYELRTQMRDKSGWYNSFTLPLTIADGLDGFMYRDILRDEMSYKWMSFESKMSAVGTGRGVNTVVLANNVIISKELGNFGFGLITRLDPPKNLTTLQATQMVYGIKSGSFAVDRMSEPLQTHRYEADHPWASTYGGFAGALRGENLAWFAVGDEVGARILQAHPKWWELTREDFATEVKKHLSDVLNDDKITLTINRFQPLLAFHLGGQKVPIGKNALFFRPEHGGFNTNSLAEKIRQKNVYPTDAIAGYEYHKQLLEQYKKFLSEGNTASFVEFRRQRYENWTKLPGSYKP
jgi:RHS repeat-associated protein